VNISTAKSKHASHITRQLSIGSGYMCYTKERQQEFSFANCVAGLMEFLIVINIPAQ
jgi:hypothetical protein